MKRRFRLRQSNDIKRVRRLGRSIAHPLLVLVAHPSPNLGVHIGIITGRQIGSAVQRNRVKRRIRACADLLHPSLRGNWDLIFLARQPISEASFQDIHSAVIHVLQKSGLLENSE